MSNADKKYYYGTGRRKDAVARVRLIEGTGKITVNGKDLDEYFGLETLKVIVKQPLTVTNTTAKYDVISTVKGGGYTGQAGATFKKRPSAAWKLFIRNSSIARLQPPGRVG